MNNTKIGDEFIDGFGRKFKVKSVGKQCVVLRSEEHGESRINSIWRSFFGSSGSHSATEISEFSEEMAVNWIKLEVDWTAVTK